MSRRKRYTKNFGRELAEPLPVRTTQEWIRFEHVDQPEGVFQFVDDALERLPDGAGDELKDLMEWFAQRLGSPEQNDRKARFWFRAEAIEYVEKARRMTELVSAAGFPVVERRTTRTPGKLNWSDMHQVAVFTYRDTPRPRRGIA
jgi:hypothetical protein